MSERINVNGYIITRYLLLKHFNWTGGTSLTVSSSFMTTQKWQRSEILSKIFNGLSFRIMFNSREISHAAKATAAVSTTNQLTNAVAHVSHYTCLQCKAATFINHIPNKKCVCVHFSSHFLPFSWYRGRCYNLSRLLTGEMLTTSHKHHNSWHSSIKWANSLAPNTSTKYACNRKLIIKR